MAGEQPPTGGVHPGHGDVDSAVAVLEESARTLGRAGEALALAVSRYRAAEQRPDSSPAELEAGLDAVAAALYRLMLQRECAGARSGNLDAIAQAYDVPAAALVRV